MTPPDLIVTGTLHDLAASIEKAPPGATCDADLHENLARSIAINIARSCGLSRVLAMLAAVDGPASLAELAQRLDAVRDVRRRESGIAAPAASAGTGPDAATHEEPAAS